MSVLQDFSKYDFIEAIQLIAYSKDAEAPTILKGQLKVVSEAPLQYQLVFDKNTLESVVDDDDIDALFLSFKTKKPDFEPKSLELNPIAEYSHETPWLLRVYKLLVVKSHDDRQRGRWYFEYKRVNERKFKNCFILYDEIPADEWESAWC